MSRTAAPIAALSQRLTAARPIVRAHWPNALLPVVVAALVALALWVDTVVALWVAAAFVVAEGVVLFHFAPKYMVATDKAELWEGRAKEVRDAHLRFRERAIHEDADTGCGNMRQLKIDWVKGVARFRRRDEPFDVVLLELHHSLGRNAVDTEVISGVAGVLLRSARAEDSVCRIGERMFAVLLSTSDYAGGHSFVERVRVRSNTELFHKGGAMTFLELRGGVAEWKDAFGSLDRQLDEAQADMVRYQAEYERQAAEYKSRPELFHMLTADEAEASAALQSPNDPLTRPNDNDQSEVA